MTGPDISAPTGGSAPIWAGTDVIHGLAILQLLRDNPSESFHTMGTVHLEIHHFHIYFNGDSICCTTFHSYL